MYDPMPQPKKMYDFASYDEFEAFVERERQIRRNRMLSLLILVGSLALIAVLYGRFWGVFG